MSADGRAPARFAWLPGAIGGMLAGVLLAGCESNTGPPPVLSVHEVEFHEDLGVDLSVMEERPSGLWLHDEVEGSAEGPEVEAASHVGVHYTGWLPDGTQFDTSDGGPPLRFVPEEGRLIPGFIEGVMGMRLGGERLILIPPHLGYGEQGAGGGLIPPNSWLVFRIVLTEI